MICSQYCSTVSPASAAIAAVPHSPIVQCSSPAASFSCRHAIIGMNAAWRRIIFCGSTSFIACG